MTEREKIKQGIETTLETFENVIATPYVNGQIKAYKDLLAFIDSLPEESASEDLEEEINHISKNEYFNFSDWKSIARHFAEWQKRKDFDDLLQSEMKFPKEFYEKGRFDMSEEIKTAYVVTRSDMHWDEVERVFFDKEKAEEYCKQFNKDENSYHRNITKIEVSL